MCGINGVFHYRDDRPADPTLIERQALVMRHRGPDDAGVWHDGSVALGHRRLAIVDLSPGGHQPMSNEDGSVWVT
ncbi:MAG TPA: asparagine synthetase B, partial [Dongiaceae bacterium]|nr:asparagine synthetase B [Dongiaceae bacterium]